MNIDKLQTWAEAQFTEVDKAQMPFFHLDVRELLERVRQRDQDLVALIVAALDEPNGIDLANRLLNRMIAARREKTT